MPSDFLLYGSTGFVGDAIGRLAVQKKTSIPSLLDGMPLR